MEFLLAIKGLMMAWPLSLELTMALGSILWQLSIHLKNKEWKKLEAVAKDEALPLFKEMMSDEEKRDQVVHSVWNAMPLWLRKFAKAEDVDKMVDWVYNTQVKPQAKREGQVKGEPKPEPKHGSLEEPLDYFGEHKATGDDFFVG